MSEEKRKLRDELKQLMETAATDSSNIASAINVGEKGGHSSISSRQRIVQRDGITTKTTETRREGRTDG